MDSRQTATELSQLARLLFDGVAFKWQVAISLEVVAGLFGVLLAIFQPDGRVGFAAATVGFIFLAVSYGTRLWVEDRYGVAETMRRQSVFSEALGWPVSKWQMDQWRLMSGSRVRKRLAQATRPDDYFGTSAPTGPNRLVQMTTESAFYTHHVYCMIRQRILVALIVVGSLTLLGLLLALTLPENDDEKLGRLIYVILPIVFAVDLVGWWLRIGRTTARISDVQRSFENLSTTSDPSTDQVLRLVAEYDGQVAAGPPIPNWLFHRWHPEIRDLWMQRQ